MQPLNSHTSLDSGLRVLLLAPWLLVLFLSSCDGRESDQDLVTCGSLVKLLNTRHNVRLHSHDVKYGSGRSPSGSPPSGSPPPVGPPPVGPPLCPEPPSPKRVIVTHCDCGVVTSACCCVARCVLYVFRSLSAPRVCLCSSYRVGTSLSLSRRVVAAGY